MILFIHYQAAYNIKSIHFTDLLDNENTPIWDS